MITCQICQREFISLGKHIVKYHNIKPKDYYDKYLKKDNEGICPECGKQTKFINLKLGYRKYCSIKCPFNSKEVKDKIKQTCLKKYGVENPYQIKEVKDKIKQNNLKKYGVENPNQSKEIQNKSKQTCLEKYGVEYSLQSKEIRNKMKQTCLDKYGTESHNSSKLIKEKKKQTCLKKYGVENPNQSKDILHKRIESRLINYYNNMVLNFTEVKPLFSILDYHGKTTINGQNIKYKWQCIKCGNIFEDHLRRRPPRCLICHPLLSGFSKQEKDVLHYIKSIYSGVIIENTRQIISPLELDIYIPELNLAIEYNGKYWHKDREKYHKMKTNLCQSKGIKLLHIAERDWRNKQDIIKDILKNLINEKHQTINFF